MTIGAGMTTLFEGFLTHYDWSIGSKEVGSRKVLVKSVFGIKIKLRITNTYHESQKI